jgi:activator of HSP90 ATPase
MNPNRQAITATRRQVIAGVAIAFGSLATTSVAFGKAPPAKVDPTSIPPTNAPCSIHQEIQFNASPHRIYETLLDSKEFAAFSGEPAEIGRIAGSAFSMFGRLIVGRNIELVTSQRIVQAWRPADWDPGVYSIVKFRLIQQGSQTKVVLDHTGFPDGTFEHLSAGWKSRYWDPLKKYFA